MKTRTGDAPQWVASLIYNALLKTAQADRLHRSRLWQLAWQNSSRYFAGTVHTTIHGQPASVNFGHTYPLYARLFHSLNNPLVELVYQVFSAKRSPITLIDVGAAIGDSIMLIRANCPEMLGPFHCVEGDAEFFTYLKANVGDLPESNLHFAMLSSSIGTERELVRAHSGTATAQGKTEVAAVTLDALLGNVLESADVIKIDVDGLDGQVLKGATQILRRYLPAVIFEWFPNFCEKTGNSWTEHFETLVDCGYSRFVWFTKYGTFSHFMEHYDANSIAMLAELCLRDKFDYLWHYDIIALPAPSPISPWALAELEYARQRRSPY